MTLNVVDKSGTFKERIKSKCILNYSTKKCYLPQENSRVMLTLKVVEQLLTQDSPLDHLPENQNIIIGKYSQRDFKLVLLKHDFKDCKLAIQLIRKSENLLMLNFQYQTVLKLKLGKDVVSNTFLSSFTCRILRLKKCLTKIKFRILSICL